MGDAPNELEVLEARREILQLEIALAQERRAAAEAEQKGKKAADEGGEPTLDYVVPASYPDARHAESLPTAGILRRGKPTLLSLPSNPAVGTHYVDNSVVVDDAARFLFGHLIGLPPPPVEVPVAPVAPWSSPLANLASRLVTLVSPLRGDT